MSASMEMPKYSCHKEVWALKIAGIKYDGEGENCETDGSAYLQPAEEGYGPIWVDHNWLARNPKVAVGGYYVVYKRQTGETETYTAYSPSEAFEDGYTRI